MVAVARSEEPYHSNVHLHAEPTSSAVAPTTALLATRRLNAYFGDRRVLRNVSAEFPAQETIAVICPSGCGKSTLLRCLNRMHETVGGASVEGDVILDGTSIYKSGLSAIAVRRQIGMVFQRPTPFPTMSIHDNVVAGLKILGRKGPGTREEELIGEDALRRSGLWDEVKDRLKDSALALSGGQQQRLCIARALATSPRILLLDEPTASLDPLSAQTIEELVHELKKEITVVIVTHNMQQAARVSDRTIFMLAGELIEMAPTNDLFTNPRDSRTEAYVTGRFG